MFKFDTDWLKDGMILHGRSYGFFGKIIRKCLPKAWGNHDGIFIFKHDRWWVGESAPLIARLTPIESYESWVDAGEYEVKIYDVVGANTDDRKKAVDYWLTHVNGTFYDFLAFPRLFFKSVFGDLWKKAAGWEWAHWCTEGVCFAWESGASMLVWNKSNPTPYTTEKRVGTTLVDVTEKVTKLEVHNEDAEEQEHRGCLGLHRAFG